MHLAVVVCTMDPVLSDRIRVIPRGPDEDGKSLDLLLSMIRDRLSEERTLTGTTIVIFRSSKDKCDELARHLRLTGIRSEVRGRPIIITCECTGVDTR